MPAHSSRSRSPRKQIYTASLRRLGTALNNPNLGLALRGTSLEEARNHRRGLSSSKSSTDGHIYVYQPSITPESNRTTLTELHGSIAATINHAFQNRTLAHWRKWKTPADYPAIMVLKNKWKPGKNRYREGAYVIGTTDYRRRLFGEGDAPDLPLFRKDTHRRIPPTDITAVVRLTKKELLTLETAVKKKYGQVDPHWLFFECRRLLINKTALAIAKAYRKELSHPPKP